MYDYKAKLIRVIDGDTIDAMIDLGFNTWVKKRIRLAGIDAFETRTRNKKEKEKGLLAKRRLQQIEQICVSIKIATTNHSDGARRIK